MIAPDREGAAVETLAALLGDIRVAGARQADWWTNDEDHRLLIQVLRAECMPWAEGLIAAGWVPQSEVTERERAAYHRALQNAHDEFPHLLDGLMVRARADRLAGGEQR